MAGNPLTDPNWPAELADTVVRVVGTVKEKTTKPAVRVTRGIVFGLLATFLGVVALTLFLIGLTRGIQALLDLFLTPERAVYVSYLLVGGILCLLGALCFRKRHSPDH